MNRIAGKGLPFLIWLFVIGIDAIAQVQHDPRRILAGVIHQLQTGTPNPLWYGPELWFTIAMQTGNTGYYPQLAQLGPVTRITVGQTIPFPVGPLYTLTALHQNGTSVWTLGINRSVNRIVYANFNVGSAPPPLPRPSPQPQEPAPSGRDTSGSSRGCELYPEMC